MINLFKKKKIRYSFYGNCQLDNICSQLNASEKFNNLYEYVPVKAVYLLQKNDLTNIKKAFSDIDVLFYQGVGQNFKNGSEFSSDNILTYLKKDCKKILISSLFFNVYFPDFHEIIIKDRGVLTTPLMGSFHDLNILNAYVNNISSSEFANIYTNKNYYDKKYCQKLLLDSYKSLQERENKNNVDIRISDFIHENLNKQKLFNCSNHPKPPVIQYVIDNILHQLDLHFEIKAIKSSLDLLESPTHPSIHQNLGLGYEHKLEFLTSKGTIDNYKKITELFYEEYRKINKNILKKALKEINFVGKLN